jgi:hypothetical protein
MAISVTKFIVSNDLSTLDLEVSVEAGQTVTSLLLWNEDTYRDPLTSIDLSSKVVGTGNTEVISISAEEAEVGRFDGMYFLLIKDSDENAVVVATFNLTQYYIIQAKLIANIDLSCLNCNANFQNALLFDMYLEATKQALLLGRFQDAIDNLSKLIITIDTSDCDECNNIDPLVSTAGNIVSVGVLDCLLAQQP